MTGLTLEDLLNGLDPEGMEKEASADEGVSEAVEQDTTAEESNVADELKSLLTKEAGEAEAEADTAISDNTEETTEMNKEAQDLGIKLAASIIESLEKQANEIQDQSDSLVSDQDSETERTPEGTTNEVLKAITDRGMAAGATDAVAEATGDNGAKEGAPSAGVGEQPVSADIEKAAAVDHLVTEEGISFDEAVDLVKAAEQAIAEEEDEHVKIAAVNELMGQGICMEDAVALVKEAAEYILSEAE